VRTDDGIVPLHALSQGTVSMVGLIGVLLPRMYDVHPTSQHPRREFAIALIDELDAHMHPRWQQTLVPKLHALFPRVQFIVTTHSPFIAAGRERTQIIRLRRDAESRRITVEPTYADTKGVDVASILTGYLFGLQTPVDPETEADLLARRELVAAETLTEAQRLELRELNIRLAGVVTDPTPDPEYNRFLRVVGERERELGLARTPQTANEEQAKLDMAREVLAAIQSGEKP
jgi:predicted ATP-binding protein involved in virulence